MEPSDLSPKELAAVARLKTVEECDQFVVNQAANPKLIQATTRKSIELQLASHSHAIEVVQDVWKALYAYEEVLFIKHGRRLKAAHTRKAIKNHGEIVAVERIVSKRSDNDDGFARLLAAGLPEMTFEAVVLKHATHFSVKSFSAAQAKLALRA